MNATKEIVDTIATLEDYPAQRDADFSAITMRKMIEAAIPFLEANASVPEVEQVIHAMCCACPKFGG